MWASLHVSFNLPQPSPHQKRSSPSRLRRRARRAATRVQAAGQAVPSEVIPVNNNSKNNGEAVDSLEKAGADKQHTVAQTVSCDNKFQQNAVQAGPTLNGSDDDSATDVVEADEEEVVHLISKLNLLARLWPSGQVEIHRDKPIVRVPPNQCEKCGKTYQETSKTTIQTSKPTNTPTQQN